MNVYVPYAKVVPQTQAAVPPGQAIWAWVGSDRLGYWALLRDLWAKGESFTLVEHDVVPHAAALRELAECDMAWCAFPYAVGDGMLVTALGCTKFGAALIERHPNLLTGIARAHRDWQSLDAIIVGSLHQRREVEHVHWPPVGHVHTEEAK